MGRPNMNARGRSFARSANARSIGALMNHRGRCYDRQGAMAKKMLESLERANSRSLELKVRVQGWVIVD
jgi:hypothetical protein